MPERIGVCVTDYDGRISDFDLVREVIEMTNQSGMLAQLQIACEQRVYPPYDALHGTPHAMLRRQLTIETPKGRAAFEQTDYGHPGKLNAWEQRGIDVRLQAKLGDLQAVAEAVERLL